MGAGQVQLWPASGQLERLFCAARTNTGSTRVAGQGYSLTGPSGHNGTRDPAGGRPIVRWQAHDYKRERSSRMFPVQTARAS